MPLNVLPLFLRCTGGTDLLRVCLVSQKQIVQEAVISQHFVGYNAELRLWQLFFLLFDGWVKHRLSVSYTWLLSKSALDSQVWVGISSESSGQTETQRTFQLHLSHCTVKSQTDDFDQIQTSPVHLCNNNTFIRRYITFYIS